MSFKKGETLEVTVSDLAVGGKGFVKVDGFSIFIDQTLPLDRALIRISKRKKNYAEAQVVQLIAPSPYRVPPKCKYSGVCGGCKWQFLDYGKQLEYKTQHVADSIVHIGLIPDVPVYPALPSDLVFGYRNKMEFSCSDKRWLLPEELGDDSVEKGIALGLHVPGTFHKVLDIDFCALQPEMGNRILGEVRDYIKKSHAPVYGLHSHAGFWRFLMLRHSSAYDQWMVNIVTASEDMETLRPLADRLRERYPAIVSIVNNIAPGKAGIAVGEYEIQLSGASHLRDKLGRFEFEISANSFFQTNTRGAERLYDTVKTYAELTWSERVLDPYSGTGTIPIWLSDAAGEVTGIEINRNAVADAVKNCKANNISNCKFILGDIKESLSGIKEKPDVMVIDPPRVGMHKDVVRQVLEIAPERIVYVSCNPSTLARDLGMMKEKYRVDAVQPVDMFPHTFHIESVAKLHKQ